MSFRQIFDRIARLARSEVSGSRGSDYERDLRRAEALIEESRGARKTSEPRDRTASDVTATTEYARACEVLGVPIRSTRIEIAAAYRERARRYHPDRVAHLSADEQSVALRRMQELNLAYEYLELNAPR